MKIGQVAASAMPSEYVCYGLGSCVGLFLLDRSSRVSGGAHIAHPTGDGGHSGAHQAVEWLLAEIAALGGNTGALRAKLAGGASIGSRIGQEICEKVISILHSRKIYIASSDVGGKSSRTVRFNSVTGEMSVANSEKKRFVI